MSLPIITLPSLSKTHILRKLLQGEDVTLPLPPTILYETRTKKLYFADGTDLYAITDPYGDGGEVEFYPEFQSQVLRIGVKSLLLHTIYTDSENNIVSHRGYPLTLTPLEHVPWTAAMLEVTFNEERG